MLGDGVASRKNPHTGDCTRVAEFTFGEEKNHSEELLGWKRMRNLPETPASHLTLHIQFYTCQDPESCSQHKAKKLSGEVCEHYKVKLDGIAG